jgi:hypothetical protein
MRPSVAGLGTVAVEYLVERREVSGSILQLDLVMA